MNKKLFNIGDVVEIEKKHFYWNGVAGGTKPPYHLKFPYTIKIKKIVIGGGYTGIFDGKYGWDEALIIKNGFKILKNKEKKLSFYIL
jgi:hypothetical protein